jgi:hypothetical protein
MFLLMELLKGLKTFLNNKIRKMTKINILFLTLFFISCINKNENANSSTQLNLNDLKKEIIYDKNNESYGVYLDVSYNDSLNYENLPMSILIAENENGNAKASVMIFKQMIELFNKKKFSIKNFQDLPDIERNFAFSHLKKAASMDNFSAQVYLEVIYRKGIGVDKNEIIADSIINILRSQKGYKEIYRLSEAGMQE